MRFLVAADKPGVLRWLAAALLALASCSSSAKLAVHAQEFDAEHQLFVLVAPDAHFKGFDRADPATINALLAPERLGDLRVYVQFSSDAGPPPRWIERQDFASDADIEVSLEDEDTTVHVEVPEELTEGSDLVLAAVLFHGGDWKACELFSFSDLAARGSVSLQVRRGRIEPAGD